MEHHVITCWTRRATGGRTPGRARAATPARRLRRPAQAVGWLAALALAATAAPAWAAPLPGGTLDLAAVPRFADPLIIPPVMPAAGVRWDPATRRLVPYYEIEVTQFQQQILPSPYPQTTVWSYGAVGRPETRNYPAFTIENLTGLPTRVKWVNGLVDASGDYLPHLLPVDQTLHWANPGQLPCMDGTARTDCRPAAPPQAPYGGPVPIVTHVHGAHVQPDSDGYPEAWYLPAARNIPAGFATRGALWGQIPGAPVEDGAATFQYRNDQPETTLWYHDHSLGMTRTNVYAGPAGFYLIRDLRTLGLRLPGPAPLPGLDPNGNPLVRRLIHEIPIVIQDRSFNADGSLFYPDNRDFFEALASGTLASAGILFTPDGFSDVAPIWNPEFFGNTMVVNGRTWPRLEVERARYRLRLLNGSDSRFLILRFEGEALPFVQIGGDQGFLPAPLTRTRLLLGPAERADVIVDFSSLAPGTRIVMENVGPDEPFGGGAPCVAGTTPGFDCDFEPSDPGSTGQVMAFDVVPSLFRDRSRVPPTLPAEGPLPPTTNVRRISLNEAMSDGQRGCFDEAGDLIVTAGTANDAEACAAAGGTLGEFGPTAALLGVLRPDGTSAPLTWSADVTENPALGATETWEIYNFTADAHPIHLHLVRFKVEGRQGLATDEEGISTQPAELLPGTARPAEAWEAGYKDTVIAYPGEVTRVTATFDIAGLYVWHCHILEHEDNEMMRPYCVGGQATCPLPLAPR